MVEGPGVVLSPLNLRHQALSCVVSWRAWLTPLLYARTNPPALCFNPQVQVWLQQRASPPAHPAGRRGEGRADQCTRAECPGAWVWEDEGGSGDPAGHLSHRGQQGGTCAHAQWVEYQCLIIYLPQFHLKLPILKIQRYTYHTHTLTHSHTITCLCSVSCNCSNGVLL